MKRTRAHRDDDPRPRRGGRAAWFVLAAALATIGALVAWRTLARDPGSTPTADLPAAVAPAAAEIEKEAPTRVALPPAPRDPTRPRTTSPVVEGWRIEGRVVGRDGVPAADARVRVELSSTTDTRTLGELATDAEGRFAQPAPALGALDPDRAPPVEVRVTVDARGFRPATVRAPVDLRAVDTTARVVVRLERGERLTGRVVDAGGRPVAQASVALSLAAHTPDSRRTPVEEVETGADGRFLLGFTSSAAYVLQARREGVGTAILETLTLEAGEARALGDVRLVGGAEIRGVVRHPDGTPVAHLALAAVAAEIANGSDATFAAQRDARDRERGDGLSTARTRTDAQGAFQIRGLRPGPYALRATDDGARLEPHDARYEPGARDVALTLDAARLVVRVVDDEGVPVRGADVRLTEVTRLPDGTWRAGARRQAGTVWPAAVATFLVPRPAADVETHVCLQAYVGTRRGPEEIVDLSGIVSSRETTVRLPRATERGELVLSVLGEDLAPLEDLRVALESTVTRARLEELERDADGRVRGVPIGSYYVYVAYAPEKDRDHFPVRTTEPVTVRAGEATQVVLSAKRGARCRVAPSPRGEVPTAVSSAISAWRAAVQGSDASRRAEVDASTRAELGVLVELTPASGGPSRTVQFRSSDGRGLLSRALPGETLESEELFEPGLYTLTFSGDAWRPSAAATVRLDAGPGAPVTLKLEAR